METGVFKLELRDWERLTQRGHSRIVTARWLSRLGLASAVSHCLLLYACQFDSKLRILWYQLASLRCPPPLTSFTGSCQSRSPPTPLPMDSRSLAVSTSKQSLSLSVNSDPKDTPASLLYPFNHVCSLLLPHKPACVPIH